MGALITHPPPHRHIDSHQASVLTEIFFSNYREQSLGPPSASSSSSSSPHFPCGANEDADSTPYWHAAKSPSLPPTVSFFPPTDLYPPPFRLLPSFYGSSSHSEMTRMKCSIINCWHADAPNEGRTSYGWGRGGGGGEDTTPKSRR